MKVAYCWFSSIPYFLIVIVLSDDHKIAGSGLDPWPARLSSPPPRLADFGYSNEMFEKDMVICFSYIGQLMPFDSAHELKCSITN